MADGKVVIDVILDDGQVAKGVANVDRSISGLSGTAESSALSIGKIVTALGLVAIARKGIDLVRDSIQSAFGRIDTMEQFENVMTVMTGSTDKANAALDATNDIVKGTAYGLDVAAAGVQNFVTRGVEVDKATGYIAAWGDAVAFYGDGSNEQFAEVSDALSKMLTKGTVGMDQLNRLFDAGIPAVDIYADAVGMSASDVQEALSNGEISAEEFVDTVTTAMMEGTDSFPPIAGAAKEAGASWGASFDNMQAAVTRGVVNVIQAIDQMLVENGLPDMREMVALFGEKFEEVLTNLAESIPAVVEKIKSVKNALEPWLPLFISIGSGVAAMVLSFATMNTAKKIISNVKFAIEAMNGALMKSPWMLAVGLAVMAVMLIIQYWEPISEFFINLWEIIKEAGLAIWEVLKKAWITTVEFFTELWEGTKEFFSELWEGIKETAVSIWDTIQEAWNTAIEALYEIFSPVIDFFVDTWNAVKKTTSTVWDSITSTLSGIWDNIKSIAQSAWELIKSVMLGPILLFIDLATGDFEGFKSHLTQIWNNIKEHASNIWNRLKDSVIQIIKGLVNNAKAIWNGFKNITSNVWQTMKSIASNIWNSLKDTVINLATSLKDGAVNAWNNLKSMTSTVWNGIKGLASSIWENIKSTVTELADNAKHGAIEAWDTLKEKTSEAFNKVVDFIKDPLGEIDLFDIGKDIIKGLIDGIGSMVGAVKDKVGEIADGIKSKITGALKIKSPSRWMRDMIGKNMMIGWIKGIDGEKSAMLRKAEQMTDWMKPEAPVVGGFANRLRGVRAPVGNIVPASYTANPSSNGASTNNNGIVNILTEQNRILSQLLRKDQDLYIDGEKVTDIVNANNAIMATISKF